MNIRKEASRNPQQQTVKGAPGINQQLEDERRQERLNFRDQRSPADLEREETDEGAAPDDVLPTNPPPGWASRNN